MTIPDKNFVYDALVEENYFPAQKKEKEELPPVFSTQGLTVDIRSQIERIPMRNVGYDQVVYKVTRFNNVPRHISVPHPLPYVQLANSIAINWDKLKFTAENDESRIKPQKHSDGRLIIMDYESTILQVKRTSKNAFGKRFVVHTDISNCFPSVYSHSIPWALIGIQRAKRERNSDLWFNKLDYHQRMLKRGETIGLPIGPATSNVIIESILGKVDDALINEGFTFSRDGAHSRFIDDYTAYCNTHTDARRFLSFLGQQLEHYRLLLNIKKTKILEQPTPLTPSWVSELSTRLSGTEKFGQIEAIRYLDFALSFLASNPDGSILKYVAKSLLSKATVGRAFLSYLLNLSFYYPILLPLFETRLPGLDLLNPFNDELLKILRENIENKRSDGMVWTLYYLNSLSIDIPSDMAKNIIETEDCFAILLLYSSGQHDSIAIDFATEIIDQEDLYLIDRHWLLLYQLFLDGKITNPYSDRKAYQNLGVKQQKQARDNDVAIFDNLKSANVSFVV